MGCTSVCLRITLATINFILLLCGIVLIGFGIWFLVDPEILSYLEVASLNNNGDLAFIIACVALAVGCTMFIVCGIGCCGACIASICLLYTYAIFVVFLILLQLAAGILAIIHNSWLDDSLEEGMYNFVQTEYDGGQTSLSESWDHMQVNMECCGSRGREDFNNSNWANNSQDAQEGWLWPQTCCILETKDHIDPVPENEDACKAGDEDAMHTGGCHQELSDWLYTWGWVIAGFIICLLILQLLVFCCTCGLVDSLKSEQFAPTIA